MEQSTPLMEAAQRRATVYEEARRWAEARRAREEVRQQVRQRIAAVREAEEALQEALWSACTWLQKGLALQIGLGYGHLWANAVLEDGGGINEYTLADIRRLAERAQDPRLPSGIFVPRLDYTYWSPGVPNGEASPVVYHKTGTGRITCQIHPTMLEFVVRRPNGAEVTASAYGFRSTGQSPQEVFETDWESGRLWVETSVSGGPWHERHRMAWEEITAILLPHQSVPFPVTEVLPDTPASGVSGEKGEGDVSA